VGGLGGRLRSWTGARRALSGGAAAAVAVPLMLVLATANGAPRTRVELSGGSAWLASPGQGLVTLIDGPSDQVVGAIRAPGMQPGDDVTVVQQGSSAYVVNPVQGTVSRVDGRTYETSRPVRFGDGGRGALLQVYPGVDSSYIVDGQRRVASIVDPDTLKVRDRLALSQQPGPGQSVVDSAGRLWMVGASGLAWFDGTGQHVRPELGGERSRLVLVGGRPQLVDLARSRVGAVSDSGGVSSWSCLELPAGAAAPVLLGSAQLGRVLAAIPSTGTLVASGDGNNDCGVTVDVGKPGDTFGALVEVGGYVFVPDRSQGRTTVVDLAARHVVAQLDVVKPGAALELLAKDGLVFYNDLSSDRAGVIRFDGGQWRAGKALRKYNPSKTGEGILTPGGQQAKAGAPGQPNKPGRNKPQDPKRPDPADPNEPQDPRQQDPTDPGQQDPGQQQGPTVPDPRDPTGGGPTGGDPTDPADPGGGGAPAGPTGPTDSGGPGGPTPPVTGPPVINTLGWTPETVVREQDATFTAQADDADGATWAWTVIDPASGNTLQSANTADSATFRLPAGTPDNLQIKLDVTTDQGTATMTKPFSTTSSLRPQIESLTATPGSAGIGQQVSVHGVENAAGDRATWAWTVTGPAGTSNPPQTAPGQDLVLTPDTAGTYTVQLVVTYDGATDRATTTISVTDTATLTAITGQIDERNGGSGTASARLNGSFTAQTVTITAPSWISVSATSLTVQPNQNASITVSVTGTAPIDGLNANAITMRLSNNSSVSFDVLANVAPRLSSANCVPTLDRNNIPVTVFNVAASDADNGNFRTAVVHVGSATYTLVWNGSSYNVQHQRNTIPDVGTWTIELTDQFGATSSFVEARGSCW
jgi:hypothetical protein